MQKKELPRGFAYRKDGKLVYRFMTEVGRKAVCGTTIKECRQKELDLRRAIADNIKIESKNMTFGQYFEEWINNKNDVCASSIYSYKKRSKRILEEIGDIKLVDLERRDILALQKALRSHLGTSSVNYCISMVRGILGEAVADRIVTYNCAVGVKPLKRAEKLSRKTNHRALTLKEQELFFAEAQSSWYYELFCFLVSTGVRSGEACALTWGDIGKEYIHITKTITKLDARAYGVGKTKTNAGTRDIPLTDSVRIILAKQRKKRLEHFGIDGVRPEALIFVPMTGSSKYLVSGTITHGIDVVLERLNKNGTCVEHFSAHALRDTFATRCIEQGMQPNTLKSLLGHTKIAMTMDLYAQVTEENKAESLKAIRICV